MFKSIRKRFSKTLYVQIWEHRIKVTDVESKNSFDQKPLVAIETTSAGQKTVSAIGNNSQGFSGNNVQVINPFSHPRVLLSDFQVGEKLLQYAIAELHKNLFIRPAPIVVIHPMEKTEGGLTEIEIRAFTELALGAGACKVYIHQGEQLSVHNFDISAMISEYGNSNLF